MGMLEELIEHERITKHLHDVIDAEGGSSLPPAVNDFLNSCNKITRYFVPSIKDMKFTTVPGALVKYYTRGTLPKGHPKGCEGVKEK